MNVELKKKYANNLLLILISFLYFYDTSLVFLPTLLSGRKIALVLLAFLFFRKKRLIKQDSLYIIRKIMPILLIIILSIFVIILNLSVRFHSLFISNSQLFSNIYYLFFFFIGLLFFYDIFNDDYQFAKTISYTHIIQSAFVYIALLFPNFRDFTASILHQLGNIALNANFRIVGFTNTGGASVSLLLFSGMAALGYLIINGENTNRKKNYYLQYLFILIATFFVAKTGFYLGLFLFFILLIHTFISIKMSIKVVLKYTFSIILVLLTFVIILTIFEPETLRKTSELTLSFIEHGFNDPSIINLINMEFPLSGKDLLLGTGIYRGNIDGTSIVLQHDSGYVRSIFSMGLIVTILFYCSHLMVLMKECKGVKKSVKIYIICFFLVLLFIEIKEAFFFKTYVQIIPFSLIFLYSKKHCRSVC